MMKQLLMSGIAAALVISAPAFARDQTKVIGEIAPGQAASQQFIHLKKGSANTGTTEVYTSGTKFSDTALFDIDESGEGNGVFTIQFLKDVKGTIQKNITNGALTLYNQTTGEYLYNNVALTSGTAFLIPFVAGSYVATITGSATGKNGGDYQITFAAPVPEPAVVGSMGLGLALAGYAATRRRRKVSPSLA